MKYLGIDFGSKRIGLAISDESLNYAFPLKVVENSKESVSEIYNICKDHNITCVVVGESKNFQMKENEIMKDVKIFVSELEKQSGLQIVLHPEFMTSAEAERIQGKNDMLDASSAAILLKSYLDKIKGKQNGKQ